MSAATPVFSTELLGRTEKTLNAILGQLLAGSGVTEQQWVALSIAVSSGEEIGRDVYVGSVAGALRVSESRARAQIAELAAARLLDVPASDGAPITVTESGQQLYRSVRAAAGEVTQRMWGDLPAADLEAAGRVLRTVLSRADAYLASTSSDHGTMTPR